MKNFSLFNKLSLIIGFGFLYLPILLLIIYSFNESKLVTVWAGFSTKWYFQAFNNQSLVDAVIVTLRVAFVSSSLATILGTLAAIALVRFEKFRGKILFSAMLFAPLVMPEVILGLALLLLFVALDIGRGILTITLAHTTFSMCFVAIVVRSKLLTFDVSLEEAARDLGANVLQTFLKITLPNIAPAIFAGWVLAFTLSLDDLVIANFNSGPGSTTLPMKIFSQVRLGVTPEINAVCTILVVFVTLGVGIATFFNYYNLYNLQKTRKI